MTKRARKLVVRMKQVRRESQQALKRHKRATSTLRKLQRQYRRAA